MYTQRFQKHNKNEFLCLPDDVIALMTSSCAKIEFFQKNVLDSGPQLFQQRGCCWYSGPWGPLTQLSADDSVKHSVCVVSIFQNDRSLSDSSGDIIVSDVSVTLLTRVTTKQWYCWFVKICVKTCHCSYQTYWVVWCVGGKNPIWRLTDTVHGHYVKHGVNTDHI